MKLLINREALHKVLMFLQSGMPSKAMIPTEDWIKMSITGDKCLVSTNNSAVGMQGYVKVESDADGEFCVPGAIMTQMIAKFPDGDVNIETVDKEGLGVVSLKLKPKGKRKNYKIGCLPSKDFIDIDHNMGEVTLKFTTSMKDFHEKVKVVGPNIKAGDLRANFSNLTLLSNESNKLSFLSGSDLIICRVDTDIDFPDSLIVDRGVTKFVSMLSENGDCEVSISKNRFKLEFSGMTFLCQMVDAKVPNYQGLMEREPEHMFDVDREELLKSLGRVFMFNESSNKVNIIVKDQFMKIHAQSANNEGEEIIDVLNPFNGELDIYLNHVFLRSALAGLKSERVKINMADNFSTFVKPATDDKDNQLWMFGALKK